MTDSVVVAFSGACGTSTQVGCVDDAGSENMSKLLLTDYRSGENLYVDVWNYGTSAPAQTSSEFLISAYDSLWLNENNQSSKVVIDYRFYF